MRLLVAWVLLVGLADGASTSVAAEPSVTAATFIRSDVDSHIELRWRGEKPRRWSGRAEVVAAESVAADIRQLHPLGIDGPTNLTPGPVLVGGIFGDSERSIVWSPPQRRSLLSAGEGRWVEAATLTGGIGFRVRGHLQDRLRVWLDRNDASASPAIDIELAELRYLEPREFEVAPGVVLTLQQTTPPLLRVTLGRGETVLTKPSKLPVRLDVSPSLARQLRAVLESDGESSGYGLWMTVTFAEPSRNGAGARNGVGGNSVVYEAALPVRIEGDRLVTDNLQLEGDFPEGAYDATVALVYGDYSAGSAASQDAEVWSTSLSKAVRSAIPGLALASLPGAVLPEGILPGQGVVRSGRICQTEFSVAVFAPRQQGVGVPAVVGPIDTPTIGDTPKIGEGLSPGVLAIGKSSVGGEAWTKLGPARWQGISAAAARVLPAAAVQWMAGATRRNRSLKFTSHEGVRLLELEPGQKAAFVAPVLAPNVRHRAVVRIPRGSAMHLAVMPLDGEATDANRALGHGAVILRNGYDNENHGWQECEVDYWPRSDSVLLMISNESIDRRARFGEIEILAEQADGDGLETPVASSPVNANVGRLACMQLDLRELFEQFGERGLPTLTRPLDYDAVLAATRRLMAAMRREGFNGLILTVASDGDALYPLEGWRPPASWDANAASTAGGVDALEAILRSFDGTGLKLIPCILPGAPDGVLEKQLRDDPTSASALTLTSPLEGQMGTWRFDAPDPTSFGHYDPTHPAVAKRLADMIGHLRRRCGGHASVHAIGLMADERSSLRLPPVEMTDEDALEMFRLSLGDQAPARGALADYLRRSKYESLELWLGQRVAAGILQGVRELGDWPLWVLSSDSALPPYLVSIAEHERITTARLHRRSLIEPIHRRVRDEACNASIPVGVGASGTALLHELAIFRQPLSDSPAEGSGPWVPDELVGGSSAKAEGSIRFCTLLDDIDASVMSGQLLTRSDRLAIAVGGGGVNQDGGEIRRRSLRRYAHLPPVLMRDVLLTDMAQSSVRLREGEYQGDAYYYVTNVTRWPVAVDVIFSAPVRGMVIEPIVTSVVTSVADATKPHVTAAAPIDLGKIWRVELAAGELAAIRIPGAGCKVVECDVRFAGSAGQIANIRQCVQDALDLSTQLAKNEPIQGLVNLGFEQSTPQGIPGWLVAQHPPDCVQVDAAIAAEGKRSLRLTNGPDRASAAWVVSQVLSPPTTGRLGVAVKLFALPQNDSEPGKPLEVRLALEGTVGGTPIRQTEVVAVPRSGQWGDAVGRIEIARLPNLPVESLRLTVDMTAPGMVWLDDVGFYDGFLTAGERTQWDHLVYLAASGAARGDFLPASRLLDSHWSVKLRRPDANVFAIAQPLDPKVWSDPIANKLAPSEGGLDDDADPDGAMVAAPFSKESIARASYATEPAYGDDVSGGAEPKDQSDAADDSRSGVSPTAAGSVAPKGETDKPPKAERERGFLQRLRGWLPLRANVW